MKKQHPKILCSPPVRAYVEAHLAEFIECRTKEPCGVAPTLLDVVKNTADTFRDIVGIGPGTLHGTRKILHEVCETFAGHWRGAISLLLDPPTNDTHRAKSRALQLDDPATIQLCIAILLQWPNLVEDLLRQDADIWTDTSGLPNGLLLAVNGLNVDILRMLLSSAAEDQDTIDQTELQHRSKVLLSAIRAALILHRPSHAVDLMRFHRTQLGPLKDTEYDHLFCTAINCKETSWIKTIMRDVDEKDRRRRLTTAINYALNSDFLASAMMLYREYICLAPRPTKPHCRMLFSTAIIRDQSSFVELMLSKEHTAQRNQAYRQILFGAIRSVRSISDKMLRVCLANNLVNGHTRYRLDDYEESQLLVYWTVAKGNITLTSTLLEVLGSSRDRNCVLEAKVLRTAIKNNSTEIVQLLLDKGFDPEGSLFRPKRSNFELARAGSAIASMIREAILEKKARLGPRYRTPVYSVWNFNAQRDDRVAYSITPDEIDDTGEVDNADYV